MIKESRFSRYMIYAFGEIILVVVGILIAVSINEWNNERKQQAEIDKLMKGLRSDLIANIRDGNKSLDFCNVRNEQIKMVIDRSITKEMYDNKEVGPIISSFVFTNVVDENLNRLLSKEDLIDDAHSDFIPKLKAYHETLDREPEMTKRVSEFVMAKNDQFVEEMTWFSDYITSGSPEATDFFLNDPLHRNRVLMYQILLIHNFGRKIADRCNTELALLQQLESMVHSETSFEKTAAELGYSPLPPIGCEQNVRLDSAQAEQYFPIVMNNSDDTLSLMLKYQFNGKDLDHAFTVAPHSHNSLEGFAPYTLEIYRDEQCIEKYGSIRNGYLIYTHNK